MKFRNLSVCFFSACVNAVALKTIQNALIYISRFAEICQHLSSMLRKGTDDTASTPQDAHTGAKIEVEVKRASKTVTKRKSNTSASDLALVNGVRQTSDMMDGAAQGVIH